MAGRSCSMGTLICADKVIDNKVVHHVGHVCRAYNTIYGYG